MYVIKVHVQLPDGSFAYLPVAHWNGNKAEVFKDDTFKDAYLWAEFILHERVRVEEEKEGLENGSLSRHDG